MNVNQKKQQLGLEARLLQETRRAMLKTDGGRMGNTKQTNHLPSAGLRCQAMDESGLATYENAY